jgi:hypothetical protein
VSSAHENDPDGLRGFQQRTRDKAAHVLFAEGSTARFLVADEVGLGKTRVARGVIRTLEEKRARNAATVIVYLAPNGEIVNQNLNVLRFGSEEHKLPRRPTLLALHLRAVRRPGLHILGFTPQTALQMSRGTGVTKERALIVALLRPIWKMGVGPAVIEVFRGGTRAPKFETAVRDIDPSGIDGQVAKRFRHAVATDTELRETFDELRRAVRSRRGLDRQQRKRRLELVGALRVHLASACLQALKPRLVILDEFHKFNDVLRLALENETLARQLLARTPTLLLSATPYRMRPAERELAASDTFTNLLRFLFNDGPNVAEAQARLKELDLAFRRIRGDDGQDGANSIEQVRTAKHKLEDLLTQVMSRYERPAGGAHEVAMQSLDLNLDDIDAYLATQQAIDISAGAIKLRQRETVELWKSAPYLVNFMRGYKVKQALAVGLVDERLRQKVSKALRMSRATRLDWGSVEKYKPVMAANPRLRAVRGLALDDEQWRALWVPPMLPPYAIEGPFEPADRAGANKMLVFSTWRVVPGAIAGMIGFDAERMASSGEKNTPAARKRRNARQPLALRYDKTHKRAQGTTALVLAYPSVTLARMVNPYACVRRGEHVPSLRHVLREAQETARPLLRRIRHHARDKRRDPRWYWAAPMLLDQEEGLDVKGLLRASNGLRRSWTGSRADAGLEANIQLALDVLSGAQTLGAQPRELARVIAETTIGAPGVCALRTLETILDPQNETDSHELISAAGRLGWGMRTLLNRPDAIAVVRSRSKRRKPKAADAYWREALHYSCQGGMQGMLDEYLPLIAEDVAQPRKSAGWHATRVSERAAQAMELQSLRVEVDDPDAGRRPFRTRSLTSRFAAAFGTAATEQDESIHPEMVRQAFNSPFWPWVLATTSVGQEGLDFHRYCRTIVHWNVPRTPVELEQREGRVQRYKSHAVRQNLVRAHGPAALASADPWKELVRLGHLDAPLDDEGFQPEWVSTRNGAIRVQRYVPMLPLSRDVQQFRDVTSARVYYRLVLGQPHPDELVRVLMENLREERAHELVDELRLDLRPR